MTVAELIAKLQEMPQDAEVVRGESFSRMVTLNLVSLCRAIPGGSHFGLAAYEIIHSDEMARRHLRHVRPVVVID